MGEARNDEELDINNPPFPLTKKDYDVLATKGEAFRRLTWDDLKEIISKNELERLVRLPSDLRRYLIWSHGIKKRYGNSTNFVIQERVHWTPLSSSGPPKFSHHSSTPFEDPRDYAVLINDWPYGLAPGIIHLIVWTKTPIPVDQGEGDVTPESRQCIREFIERYFKRDLDDAEDRVMWFKNWVSLQSVRGVDHVHVLVRDVPEDVLKKWTVRRDL